MRDLLRKGHAALVEETKKEVTKAFAQDLPRARDFTCTQVPILVRRLAKFHEEREQLRMRIRQVTGRVNLAIQDRGADLGPLLAAQDNLMKAAHRYDDLIRRGRVQRKLMLKACRVRR